MAEELFPPTPVISDEDIPAVARPAAKIGRVVIDPVNKYIEVEWLLGVDNAGTLEKRGLSKKVMLDNPKDPETGDPLGTQWFDGVLNGQQIDGTLCSGKRFAKLLRAACVAKGDINL